MSELRDLEEQLTSAFQRRAESAVPPNDAWDQIVAALSGDVSGVADESGDSSDLDVLPEQPMPGRSIDRKGILLLAAAIVLLAGLYIVLRSTSDDSTPVFIEEPEVTTTTELSPATSSSASPLTSTPEGLGDPSFDEQERLPSPSSGETQKTVVGDIMWTLLEGDENTLPEHVTSQFDGEFFGWSGFDVSWRSSNGIDWTRGEPLVDGWLRSFEFDGDTWGLVYSNTGISTLSRWNGASFDPVEFPVSGAPQIVGLDAQGIFFDQVLPFDEVVVSSAQTMYTVRWTDFYEANDPPPPPNGPPDGEPMLYAEWDSVTERIRLHDAFANSQTPVAVLAAEVTSGIDGRVDLRDDDTGEIVTTIYATPDLFGEELANVVTRGFFSHSEMLIGTDGEFQLEPVPWPGSTNSGLATFGSQLLAIVRTESTSTAGEPMSEWELWTSPDAQSWSQLELPETSGGVIDHVEMVATGDSLLLTMIVTSSFDQQPESWTTRDAVTWVSIDPEFDDFSGLRAAEFGWYRDDPIGGLWVSPDAVTWQVINLDIREPRGAGGVSFMVVGNTVFVTSFENSGARTMWVGVVN